MQLKFFQNFETLSLLHWVPQGARAYFVNAESEFELGHLLLLAACSVRFFLSNQPEVVAVTSERNKKTAQMRGVRGGVEQKSLRNK